MVGLGQCKLFVHLYKKWVSLCGCVRVYLYVPCADVFVCTLVGNVATSCVSGDTGCRSKTTRDLKQIFGESISNGKQTPRGGASSPVNKKPQT